MAMTDRIYCTYSVTRPSAQKVSHPEYRRIRQVGYHGVTTYQER